MSSIEELLEAAGVEQSLAARLARFGTLVLEANRRFNLTGAKDGSELVGHFLDSLSVAAYIREPYADVGSGAGFPAIPAGLACGIAPTMIESNAKKARFLEMALDRLELEGQVVAERAESAAHRPELRERFASGTGRAVGSAPTVAELLLPLIEPGGLAVLQRGTLPPDERRALEDAALMLGANLEAELELGDNGRLILLRKRGPTPARFPRRIGIPAKRPLCT